MTIELAILAWGCVLAFVYIWAAVRVKTRQYGVQWNIGARDEELAPPPPIVGRLARAQANFFETFPLFAAAVLIVSVAAFERPLDRDRRLALARGENRVPAPVRGRREGNPDPSLGGQPGWYRAGAEARADVGVQLGKPTIPFRHSSESWNPLLLRCGVGKRQGDSSFRWNDGRRRQRGGH